MGTATPLAIDGNIYFTSGFPDVTINGTDGTPLQVTVTCDGNQVLDESLWPSNGVVTLKELGETLKPYVRRTLVSSVAITVGMITSTCTVLYATVDVGVSAETFFNSYFLSILMGTKVTAMGRRELLWYYGNEQATATAEYADGTTENFNVEVAGNSSTYTCLDVSPDLFVVGGKELVAYTITAGQRSQRFEMDFEAPDCAPILEFYNSFGVWEYIYCTGTHTVSPDYKRSSARLGGMLRNYRIEETRTFKADTGVLTTPMAAWADELFRSEEVYVVNVIDGEITDSDGGKEVVITESKSEQSNDDDQMPRFTFSYQYSQRIHNVLQTNRVGRIFDNTFDHTFN